VRLPQYTDRMNLFFMRNEYKNYTTLCFFHNRYNLAIGWLVVYFKTYQLPVLIYLSRMYLQKNRTKHKNRTKLNLLKTGMNFTKLQNYGGGVLSIYTGGGPSLYRNVGVRLLAILLTSEHE
jgi:hypothetical protein